MKVIMALSAMALSLVAQASAALITVTGIDGKPDPDTVITSPELVVVDHEDTNFGLTESVSGQYVSPWGGDSDNEYTSVQADGFVTYGFAEEGIKVFTLLWGSMDTWNDIEFYNDGQLLGTLNGGDVRNQLGKGTSIVQIALSTAFDQVKLVSTRNAFEHVVVSAEVPVPAAVLLFGSALAGFGALRRRTA